MYAWMIYEFCTSYLSFGMLHCTFITQPMSMQKEEEEVDRCILSTECMSTGALGQSLGAKSVDKMGFSP